LENVVPALTSVRRLPASPWSEVASSPISLLRSLAGMAFSRRVAEATTAPTSAGTWLGAAGTVAPLCSDGASPPCAGTRFTTCSPRSFAICTEDCTSSGTVVPGLMRIVTLVAVLVSAVEVTVPTGTPFSSTSKPA
jgi:hypothetical protein